MYSCIWTFCKETIQTMQIADQRQAAKFLRQLCSLGFMAPSQVEKDLKLRTQGVWRGNHGRFEICWSVWPRVNHTTAGSSTRDASVATDFQGRHWWQRTRSAFFSRCSVHFGYAPRIERYWREETERWLDAVAKAVREGRTWRVEGFARPKSSCPNFRSGRNSKCPVQDSNFMPLCSFMFFLRSSFLLRLDFGDSIR